MNIPAWLARILREDNRTTAQAELRFAQKLALPNWVARCNSGAQDQLLSNIVERIGYSPN